MGMIWKSFKHFPELARMFRKGRNQRFRPVSQTTPLAIRASTSSLDYPNSVKTAVECSLNFGGSLRRLALVRSKRIGEATTPLLPVLGDDVAAMNGVGARAVAAEA
jgi:hypothetical protein